MTEEVAAGIFATGHAVAEGKNAVVFGERAALPIDAGTYPEEGRLMADLVRDKGFCSDRFALTHGHGDHILGGEAFRDCEIFAHERTPSVIRNQLRGWAERWDVSVDEAAARVIRPTVMFNEGLTIDLGGKTVRFFPTPGHSVDGVSAYVVEDKTLIAGDSVVTGIVPAIGDGDSRVLQSSLQKLATMEAATLIPGHGPVVYGADNVRDWIVWIAGYLKAVRRRARKGLAEGMDGERVIESIRFEEFIGGRLPADKHNMPSRHRAAVAKIVDEETDGA